MLNNTNTLFSHIRTEKKEIQNGKGRTHSIFHMKLYDKVNNRSKHKSDN